MFNFDFQVGVVESENGYSEVVKFILWKLTDPVTGESMSGHTDLQPPSNNFIDFKNLTKDQVRQWVYANHDMDIVENIILEKRLLKDNSSKIVIKEII